MGESLYDGDFYAWANEQAALLRAGKLPISGPPDEVPRVIRCPE